MISLMSPSDAVSSPVKFSGQMRMDGAFCVFTREEKLQFMGELQQAGVKNIEMESVCFAAFTHRAGCRGE